MEVGRICRKVRGKDAGEYCVIVDKAEKGFVVTEGKGTKKKKTNITHLEPLPVVASIKAGASNADVVAVLEKENLL